ncbi:MAG TPA: L-histidine N(alpha)-methyltransferase [Candidatus Binatia bacterium]|nr:L-histidine N(alpha)-methyltransferase [Candidatus Binatia bacterium]
MKARTAAAASSARAIAAPETGVGQEQLDFARAVRFYLQQTPRQLPSRFLYDALGSALFDAICHLPWYGITRAELRLLRQHAGTIGQALGRGGRVVELGCGNGEKLATLLRHAGVAAVHAHLIDLSEAALVRSVQALEGPDIRVTTHQTTYEEGLLALPGADAPPTLVVFLGSNIGNFDRPGAAAFLGLIRTALRPGDGLLLGADLVKPERDLLLAYDDPLGLTGAFNKNLLQRLNTELHGNFALNQFDHRAVWDGNASRVEMHLVSRVAQDVLIERAGLRFRLEAGETIWTESSYKFEAEGIGLLVEPTGFTRRQQWIDQRARFALTLFAAV